MEFRAQHTSYRGDWWGHVVDIESGNIVHTMSDETEEDTARTTLW